jgi:transposase
MSPEVRVFNAALGLSSPWHVVRVEFKQDVEELHLYIDFARGALFRCPECGGECKAYDSDPDRVWRHLDFFEHKTFLHARFPRVNCRQCGVKTVEGPWSRPESGFTLMFEAYVLTLCKYMPVRAAAKIVGEHDTRLWRVLDHHVEQARREQDMSEVKQVGVDETSSKPGHNYVTLFADTLASRVLAVAEGKDASTVSAFREELQKHGGEPQNIEVVSMDFSPAFNKGVSEEFSQAEIAFDPFHVMKTVNDALDQVRRSESKESKDLKQALKKTRYLWLKNPEDLSPQEQGRLEELHSMTLSMNLKTLQAYQMKLKFQQLWQCPDRDSSAAHLEQWVSEVLNSDIAPAMKKAAQTIKDHAAGILHAISTGVNNGMMEGFNSLVQAAKSKARGYRNFHYLATIIFLLTGKLYFHLDPFLPT